jgi:cytochrome c
MSGESRQGIARTSKVAWLAAALVAVTLPTAVAQVAAGASASAVTESPAYKRGRLLYIQCRACHDLKPTPVEKVGPNLAGLFGRPAAAAADFEYSPALINSKITWDRKTLDTWLEKPGTMVPGNIMAFAGIANPADRVALITYIEVESAIR